MNTPFPMKSFISSGWHTFKKHWKFVILAGLATAFVQFVLNMLQRGSDHSGVIVGFVVSVFAGIVGLVVALGWTRVLLALNRHDAADWDTFKTEPKLWMHFIKVMIWYILNFIKYALIFVLPLLVIWGILRVAAPGMMTLSIVLGGLLALSVALLAIYFGVRYQFLNFVLLDSPGIRSKAIFKKSGELTKGYFWQLVGFGAVLLLLNIVGLICLVVGLAITIPVSKLAQARVYDYLKNKKGSGHTEIVIRPEEVAAPIL